jgi:hypothetical protein
MNKNFIGTHPCSGCTNKRIVPLKENPLVHLAHQRIFPIGAQSSNRAVRAGAPDRYAALTSLESSVVLFIW